MQDECNVKTGKRSFTGLDTAEPMLILSKIMQDECNVKTGKRSFTGLDTAEPMLILCKDSERLAHCKLKSVVFSIFADIVQYTILCQIRSGKINN